MVDEIGGIDDAIAYAASKAKLKDGVRSARRFPSPRTLADYFSGGRGADDVDAVAAADHRSQDLPPEFAAERCPRLTEALIRAVADHPVCCDSAHHARQPCMRHG